MSHDLTAKQRNSAFQHWCSQITRESRDLAGLERIGARALQDRDVRADTLLESMVRAEMERYRADLQDSARRGLKDRASTPLLQKHCAAPSRRDNADLLRSRGEDMEDLGAELVTIPAPPAPPPPPDLDEVAFRQMVERLGEALQGRDEDAARILCAQMGVLHQRRGEIDCAADLEKYEEHVTNLNAQLNDHRSQIAGLAQQAQAAAQDGNRLGAVELLGRLAAIHVTHPRLLDQAGLKRMRDDVAHANEGHEDGVTTRRLIEREREVAAEMKRLAGAVSEYHRAVFNHPESSAEFRRATPVYLRALREIRLHEKDWLAEFVLELGDVLANWNVSPPGAAQQIDRFLEKVRSALQRIHANMGEINTRRGGRQSRDAAARPPSPRVEPNSDCRV